MVAATKGLQIQRSSIYHQNSLALSGTDSNHGTRYFRLRLNKLGLGSPQFNVSDPADYTKCNACTINSNSLNRTKFLKEFIESDRV